jgi:hypothetical protein
MALALAACSGDDGGGEAGVTYTGATTQATVTDANAAALTTTAYQGGNSGGSFALVGVMTDSSAGVKGAAARGATLSRVLTDAVKAARFNPHSSSQAAVGATQSVSGELDPGNCGGTASFSGTANDVTGEIRASFTFSSWCNDDVTVSGRVTASGQIDVSTESLLELEFSFSVLTVSDGTDTFRGRGSVTVSFGDPASILVDMDFAASDGTVFRASNLDLTATATTNGENFSVTGRVFHPVHGYVDISTPVALLVETGQAFPSSGELVVTGAAGSKAKLTALSPTQFQIEVDQDGDDTYETDLGTFDWDAV